MNTKSCPTCGKEFTRPVVPRYDGAMRLISSTIWNKRIYCSCQCFAANSEIRESIRKTALRAGYGKWMTGKKHTEETKRKIAAVHTGKAYLAGRKLSEETKRKISAALKGANGPGWQGGKMQEKDLIRSSLDYRIWRKSVFERDGYTCRICGGRGCRLNADHILPFSLFPHLRLDLNNGRTLCVPCHKLTPTYLKSANAMRALYPDMELREL